MRFDTLLIQGGQRPTSPAGDVVPPIHVSTTYERGMQDPLRYVYCRGENPTREGLEECLADLEDARYASVYASGQAAAATVLSLLTPGLRVVASDDLYSGTNALFGMLSRLGIAVELVDLSNLESATRALDQRANPDPALVWIETPSNPLLKITDLEAVCRLAHQRGALVVVDNTLASPAVQQPLRWADISLYSTTKSIAGHLDALGGALVYDDGNLHERFTDYRNIAGNVPGALDCYLIRRGLKTLSLRTARQAETAAAVVAALQAEPMVSVIRYPGLAEHPGNDVADRQMSVAGSMISFDYSGDISELLDKVRVFAAAVSLGGVQSLIECPALMTHASIPRDTRLQRGITDNLIRLSIGIEDPEDLLEDLRHAMPRHRTATTYP